MTDSLLFILGDDTKLAWSDLATLLEIDPATFVFAPTGGELEFATPLEEDEPDVWLTRGAHHRPSLALPR